MSDIHLVLNSRLSDFITAAKAEGQMAERSYQEIKVSTKDKSDKAAAAVVAATAIDAATKAADAVLVAARNAAEAAIKASAIAAEAVVLAAQLLADSKVANQKKSD
jgi:hypothetical protein